MSSITGVQDPTAGYPRATTSINPSDQSVIDNIDNSSRKAASMVASRFATLKSLRSEWETTWADIVNYVVPRRGGVNIEDSAGQRPKIMYDGTAAHAVQILADGFLSYLTSPMAPWFRVSIENDPMVDESDTVKRWFGYTESVFAYIFAHSNFYSSMNMCLLDGCSYGTACMFIDEDIGGGNIYFSARNPKEIYISENYKGIVDTVYRNYKSSARCIVDRFPDAPDWIKELAISSPDTKYNLIHAVEPRKDRDTTKIDNVNKAYSSVYMLERSGEVLEESGYTHFPYAVWRFRVNSSETYGTSPAWDAMSDIKSAQAIMKTLMEKAHQSVKPAVQAPAELKGEVSLEPDGVTWYLDPNRQVSAINTGGEYPVGRDMQEKIQAAIRDHFRTDFFLSLNQAALANRKTAYEVSVLQGEKASVLAAPVDRIEKEFLNSVFDRVFALALRNDWIPDPPPTLKTPINIVYTGPLALQQKRHFNQSSITQGLAEYSQFVSLWPEFQERLNADDLAKRMLEAASIPQTSIKTDKELAEQREAKAEQEAAMMAQQEAMTEAEMYDKTTKAPEGGSAAEGLMQ